MYEHVNQSFLRSTTCNGNALFAENELYELYNLYNQNKGLICGELMCGETWHFQKLGCGNIFLTHSRQFMSVKIQLFCEYLSSRKFPILQNKHFGSVFFYEKHLNLAQS